MRLAIVEHLKKYDRQRCLAKLNIYHRRYIVKTEQHDGDTNRNSRYSNDIKSYKAKESFLS